MKNFIIKSILFVGPFLTISILNSIFYKNDEGDLLRLGFIYAETTKNELINKYANDKTIYFKLISNKFKINEVEPILSKKKIFIIGDSFSEQSFYGYKNILAKKPNVSVLHLDRDLHNNPIQTLIALVNGDFFNSIDFDYIILECVERHFVEWSQNLNFDSLTSVNSIKMNINERTVAQDKKLLNSQIPFFSKNTLLIPIYNIGYLFNEKPFDSKVYKLTLEKPTFSNNLNNLFVYHLDIKNTPINNQLSSVFKLNESLNMISQKITEKGKKLIVLPAPDKYSIYYDFISNKEKFPEPNFYKYFKSLNKNYIYIHSHDTLKFLTKFTKDVYFYDDTHWSPIASEKIADMILTEIGN